MLVCVCVYVCGHKLGLCKNPHDGLFLSARAKVALHLGLVHAVQGQHEEDSTYAQGPKGVALQRVGVQTVEKGAENLPESTSLPKQADAMSLWLTPGR